MESNRSPSRPEGCVWSKKWWPSLRCLTGHWQNIHNFNKASSVSFPFAIPVSKIIIFCFANYFLNITITSSKIALDWSRNTSKLKKVTILSSKNRAKIVQYYSFKNRNANMQVYFAAIQLLPWYCAGLNMNKNLMLHRWVTFPCKFYISRISALARNTQNKGKGVISAAFQLDSHVRREPGKWRADPAEELSGGSRREVLPRQEQSLAPEKGSAPLAVETSSTSRGDRQPPQKRRPTPAERGATTARRKVRIDRQKLPVQRMRIRCYIIKTPSR